MKVEILTIFDSELFVVSYSATSANVVKSSRFVGGRKEENQLKIAECNATYYILSN
jgi:hypothetical protein